MVSVRVLYFAVLRDLVGKGEEMVELADDAARVECLFSLLENRYESLRGKLTKVRAAKNQTFALASDTLASGDEIALIPPVAGG